MLSKSLLAAFISVIFLVLAFSPALSAQMKSVIKFKGVTIPFTVNKQDVTIKKGNYDFEMVRHQARFCLRIYKGRKLLGTFEGDNSPYVKTGVEDIPSKPRFRMNKFSDSRELVITIETGTMTSIYPMCRMKFRFNYNKDAE